jgi:hypothetical protein
MIAVHRRALRVGAAVLSLGLLATGCGSPSSSAKGQVAESTTTTTIAKGPDSTAAQLRSKLAGLLEEHLYLAAAVSSAGGRGDEATAAQGALGGNSDALVANMTAIFTGNDATVAKQFGDLWKGNLAQNANGLGTLLNSALSSLPADAVSGPLGAAEQAAGNGTNFTGLRAAAAQMVTMGSALAGAIAKKFPDTVGGNPASKAADLLTNLNAGLREHVYLVAAATDASIGGRADEFNAAKAAVDANSAAVTDTIAGVFGADAGKAFGPLWAKHIGFLYDYAAAVAAKQQAAADTAMKNLLDYGNAFGAFINGAIPKLSADSAGGLITAHVSILKDMMDAQAAKDWSRAYGDVRTGADHMSSVATTLVGAIVSQLPNQF